VLIGFKDSSVQIRDVKMLNHILFEFEPKFEDPEDNEVVNFKFHMDIYANLCIQYKRKATFNIILERQPESLYFSMRSLDIVRSNYVREQEEFVKIKDNSEFLFDGN
jgi:hypothetical protein